MRTATRVRRQWLYESKVKLECAVLEIRAYWERRRRRHLVICEVL
jgi:hypothetical protein